MERAKNLHEQSGERESSGADAEREVTEMGFNAEQQNSPLRSATMFCTGVIKSVLRKSQPASYTGRAKKSNALRKI